MNHTVHKISITNGEVSKRMMMHEEVPPHPPCDI